ncbi:MAG: hypothetical protein ACM3IL_00125, partial [Deltaproteobacteria bacterium]
NSSSPLTGRQTKEAYLARIAELETQGSIRKVEAGQLRFRMTAEDETRYLAAIEEVLAERGESTVNPEVLFEAARRSLIGRTSSIEANVALQPGTMNPLTYGHITAGLASIIDKKLDRVILANGGTVPDKPYAASADIRNQMANIATQDAGLSDWLMVTPLRAQTVEMFQKNLSLAGANENARRFSMDIAAFIWLFVANPNAHFYYIVGADKLAEYGKKNEINLLQNTLHRAGVNVLYFGREEGGDFSYEKHIQPFEWLNTLWNEGLFVKSGIPSFEDVSATKVRKALATGKDAIEGVALSEMIPQGVVDYIKSSHELLTLYKVEFTEKEADKALEQKDNATASAKYNEAIRLIDELISSGTTTTQASFDFLKANLNKKLASVSSSPILSGQNQKEAFLAIVGLEIAKRIHAREFREGAKIQKESYEALEKGEPITKFYLPTPQDEFVNRVNEAVIQVARRLEYRVVLTNPWATSQAEYEATIAKLTEEFALSIFRNVAVKIGLDVTPYANAAQLADTLRNTRLDLSETIAKLAIYSGPPGGGKGAVWEEFTKLYGDLINRFILFHTRGIRKGEVMGVNYHYRNEEHLRKLEAEGKIITALVNNQLQGMAIQTFEDTYTFVDPQSGETISGTATVQGLDSVFKGNKVVVLECGLAWFEALYAQYGDNLMSIFITPLSNDYLIEASRSPEKAFVSIVGLEVAKRIHHRERKEAEGLREKVMEAQEQGRKVEKKDIFLSTPQPEFINRINESVTQVRRRHEYKINLVNRWVTREEFPAVISQLTEEFARAVLKNIATAVGLRYSPNVTAAYLENMLRKAGDRMSTDTPAKLAIYSGPPGGGKGAVYEEFKKLYAVMIERFILFHSRGIRDGETMGVNYHYRNEDHLRRLEAEGKIITALINNQLQGLAIQTFEDTYTFVDPKSKQVYTGTERVIGLDQVFKGNKIVLLECGLAWFEALHAKYGENLMSIFISPFSDDYLAPFEVSSSPITARSVVLDYLSRVERLHSEGSINKLNPYAVRFNMTQAQKDNYLAAIKKVLKEKKLTVITPEVLFEAADIATKDDKSSVEANIGLQPGTMNPLHYGHVSASLAGIITNNLNMVLLANGGTVPDKPYAASADIRNEMARAAVTDEGLRDWLQVTPIRQQIVEMFEDAGALELAGTPEEFEAAKKEKLDIKSLADFQRFNMDIAAFIWLFVANPRVRWTYLVGSDKVAGYGKKGEKNLIVHTLGDPRAKAQVVYFAREGEDIDLKSDIDPFTWLKEKFDSGFFKKSPLPSFEDISATKVRIALVKGEAKIKDTPITEFIAPAVYTYIRNNRTLLFLYEIEINEKDAEVMVEGGLYQRALGVYRYLLKKVDEERSPYNTARNIPTDVAENLFALLSKGAAKVEKTILLQNYNIALIHSPEFIADINSLLAIFDKPALAEDQYNAARALAYEANRRLSSRDGVLMFRREKRSHFPEGETDPENERYNRVLEGVVQILNRNDYGAKNVIQNPWGYSEETRERILQEVSERFAKIFFAGIVKGMQRALALTGHEINAPPEIAGVLAELSALSDEEIEAKSAQQLFEEFVHPIVESEQGLLIFPALQQKLFLFSAGPGTGKDAVWKAFKKAYEKFIDKLLLYHTRNPRVKNGKSEKDGKAYHFRTEAELRALGEKVYLAWVNRQLQGLAKEEFYERRSIQKKDLADDKRGTSLTTDREVPYTDNEYTIEIERKIVGLKEVFSGRKPVVLEGGYGWFLSLRRDNPDIIVAFITPFNEDEINMRAANTVWIHETFKDPTTRRLAYEEMSHLIAENKGEIDIAGKEEYQDAIKQNVARHEKESSSPIQDINELDAFDRNNYYRDEPAGYWRSKHFPRLVLGTTEDIVAYRDSVVAMVNHVAIRTHLGYSIYAFDDHKYSPMYLKEAQERGEVPQAGNDQIFLDQHYDYSDMSTPRAEGLLTLADWYRFSEDKLTYETFANAFADDNSVARHLWVYDEGTWKQNETWLGMSHHIPTYPGDGAIDRSHPIRNRLPVVACGFETYFARIHDRPKNVRVILNIDTDVVNVLNPLFDFLAGLVKDRVSPSTVHISTSLPRYGRVDFVKALSQKIPQLFSGASSPVTDQARPLPGQHMPSGRAVRKSIESVGWQGANTKAI